MLPLHLLQSCLVHINTLLLPSFLQDPKVQDGIGPTERAGLRSRSGH